MSACLLFVHGALAHATSLYPAETGHIEAELEVVAIPWDLGAEFDELDPIVLFGVMGGVYVADGLRLQVGVRASVSDPEAEHFEAVFGVGYTWTQTTALTVPPALRLGARVELGWRWLEMVGSDFVVNDDGPTLLGSFEIGIVPFESFAIVARIGLASVFGSNGVLPETQVQLRTGIAFVGVY